MQRRTQQAQSNCCRTAKSYDRFRPIAVISGKLTITPVAALHFARIAFLASILVYAVVLTAGISGVLDGGWVMLLGWIASLLIAVTAAACVIAQVVMLFAAIRFAIAVARDTDGAFDPTVGARMDGPSPLQPVRVS